MPRFQSVMPWEFVPGSRIFHFTSVANLEQFFPMFSLQKLFAKKDVFYDLLDQSAEEAHASVHLLLEMLKQANVAGAIEQLNEHRRRDKKIKQQITEELCRTFITPIEREDIESIAAALCKIPKAMIKFAEHYTATPNPVSSEYFLKQAALLDSATETVVEMVRELRSRTHPERVRSLNEKLHMLEGEADKLMFALTRDLYSGKHDVIEVLVLKDLNALLEKAIDRCRDAGNVILQVVLKYS